MVYAGEKPEDVIDVTPHGCRHVQVTAATQLAARGVITETAIESLCQWEKGAKMLGLYDSSFCVTELSTRKNTSDALRSGWDLRPTAAFLHRQHQWASRVRAEYPRSGDCDSP